MMGSAPLFLSHPKCHLMHGGKEKREKSERRRLAQTTKRKHKLSLRRRRRLSLVGLSSEAFFDFDISEITIFPSPTDRGNKSKIRSGLRGRRATTMRKKPDPDLRAHSCGRPRGEGRQAGYLLANLYNIDPPICGRAHLSN